MSEFIIIVLSSGFYWIDPNDGIPDDAIRVQCDHFTHSSCLFPQNKTEVMRRNAVCLLVCLFVCLFVYLLVYLFVCVCVLCSFYF